MIRQALKRAHRGQGGFTLIEVLVVMTILGILAAIVSISLLGVTASARAKARDAERQTVQAAFDAMLSDQQVKFADISTGCDGSADHNNMATWPTGVDYVDPSDTKNWVAGKMTHLATHYLREPTTNYGYSCDANGDIKQSTNPIPH
jgi:prepilin-type N-terminal cleavage/methylation domain-containing protein